MSTMGAAMSGLRRFAGSVTAPTRLRTFGRLSVLGLCSVLLSSCLGGGGDLAPKIFQQPRDRSSFLTQTALFDVGVEGTTPLSYQWRRNGVNIAGATGPTYTTPALTAADNGARFSIVITNPVGSTTSSDAVLTVLPAPTITTSPTSQTVAVGATATFTVTATGESLAYQWRKDDLAIAGATSASYTTPATVAGDDGAVYTADVGNGAGFVTSAPATLSVTSVAAVVTSPVSQTVAVGDAATFGVTATGSGLTYQWRRNGADIAGATSALYTIPSASLADTGATFNVVVTNPRGTATSGTATLTVVAAALTPPPALPAEVAAAKTITTAESFALVRRSTGVITSWGYNGEGQRGDGTSAAASDTPGTVTLPAGLTATAIAAGGNHALALLSNGTVYAWGRNGSGQLGIGDQALRLLPTLVVLPRPAVAIAAGRDFSLAVLDDGTICAWGLNASGQLGNGVRTTSLSLLPVQVSGVTTARTVAAGNEHALALLADGTVLAWGANAAGQLGLGDFKIRRAPVATPLRNIAVIRAGGDLSVAITNARTAIAWGENSDAQLGTAGALTTDFPVPLGVLPGVVDAAPVDRMLLLVGSDGAIRGAGANDAGSLGDGTTTARTSFTAATGLTGMLGASSGGRTFALGLRSDGSIFSWGDNSGEQLGNSTLATTGTSTPTLVPNVDAIP